MRLAVVLLSLWSSLSWGLGKVQFGSEFTFWDPKVGLMEDPNPMKRVVPTGINVIERMRNHLVQGQPEGAKFVETIEHSLRQSLGRFTSPNGWWFEWGYDDSVLEVKLMPESPEYFRHYKSDIQDAIFVSAGNEGLWPAMFLGGGHINIGLSAFEGNPLLLRNFVVDLLFNHNELFLGIFNYDTNNAASIFVQENSVRRAVLKVIADFDAGAYNHRSDVQTAFLDDIYKAIDATDPIFERWKTGQTRHEYTAVNFSHVSDRRVEARRIELRGVRPQASMDMFINQIDLLEKRMLYLEKIHGPIAIAPVVPVEQIDPDKHILTPPVEPPLAIKAFYRFVTESGAQWKDHREYIWPKWISDGDLARFEASEYFHRAERDTCAKNLVSIR